MACPSSRSPGVRPRPLTFDEMVRSYLRGSEGSEAKRLKGVPVSLQCPQTDILSSKLRQLTARIRIEPPSPVRLSAFRIGGSLTHTEPTWIAGRANVARRLCSPPLTNHRAVPAAPEHRGRGHEADAPARGCGHRALRAPGRRGASLPRTHASGRGPQRGASAALAGAMTVPEASHVGYGHGAALGRQK